MKNKRKAILLVGALLCLNLKYLLTEYTIENE